MLLKIFSIRDAKTEVYNTPFFQKTIGEAERNFSRMVVDPKTVISQYPEDYDLYHLGEYDDNEGKFQPLDSPRHICKAIQFRDLPKPGVPQEEVVEMQ